MSPRPTLGMAHNQFDTLKFFQTGTLLEFRVPLKMLGVAIRRERTLAMVETNHGGPAPIDRERPPRTHRKNSFAIWAVSHGEKGLGPRMIISFQFPKLQPDVGRINAGRSAV